MHYFCDFIRVNGKIVLEPDELRDAADEMIMKLTNQQKAEILDNIIAERIDYVVQKRIQDNFIKVQNDVREIIRKECEVTQEITPHSNVRKIDIDSIDPFNEGS